jgi:predicted phosphoadenosine phosphosulfate sulfurtransferase
MNKVDELVNIIKEAFFDCADRVSNQELWEDYANVQLPDLTPEETKELIYKIQNFLHYYNWADLPTIMQETKTASVIMVYVDDVSSWWRFEA